LVKWKNKSYLHCTWETELIVSKIAKQKLRHFLKNADDEYEEGMQYGIKPEWKQVDRIIGRRVHRGKTEYYIKWKALNYDHSTWEPDYLIEPLDCQKQIAQFLNLTFDNAEKESKNYTAPTSFQEIEEQPSYLGG
jgi:hypothetical protein